MPQADGSAAARVPTRAKCRARLPGVPHLAAGRRPANRPRAPDQRDVPALPRHQAGYACAVRRRRTDDQCAQIRPRRRGLNASCRTRRAEIWVRLPLPPSHDGGSSIPGVASPIRAVAGRRSSVERAVANVARVIRPGFCPKEARICWWEQQAGRVARSPRAHQRRLRRSALAPDHWRVLVATSLGPAVSRRYERGQDLAKPGAGRRLRVRG